ncbi:MAG: outer membrane protein transport protein [Chitinispirillales bacterium]|jgi:long-chain fatty acid transport protein|nr:outer membrane protein transport protein [Chitinispirillales bacterium]
MKKLTFAVILAACSFLFGEAYQVNTLSARQLGMAHTGAGLKLGSESMHFNPGALGFLDSKFDASGGVTMIIPKVQFWGVNGHATPENNPSTPVYFYAAGNIKRLISLGLSFTTPYGNSASWDKNWEGAGLIQDISLKVFALQPTFAVNILDKVSVGAGPTINFGNFEQSKQLAPIKSLEAYRPLAYYDSDVGQILDRNKDGVNLELSGKADVAVGVNAGILFEAIKDKLAFGVSYRSGVKAKVSKGDAKIAAGNDIDSLNRIISRINSSSPEPAAPNIPPELTMFNSKTFEAELPLPANMNVGVSFRPVEKLLLDFDLQWVNWGAYDKLNLVFHNITTVVNPKKYENTFAYRLGTQIGLHEKFDLRFGIYYDQTPVPDDFLNPETPSTNKLGVTTGGSFRPVEMLSIDFAFLYSHGFNRDGSCPNPPGRFSGGYKVEAFVPSIGLSFKF